MAAIVQPLGEPTFEDTHREIRRELEHGLDAMGKEQPGLAETCYAAALERASALDPASRLTANCLGYLARACAAQRKHKRAATMHERQLLILKELAGRGEASALARASVLLALVVITSYPLQAYATRISALSICSSVRAVLLGRCRGEAAQEAETTEEPEPAPRRRRRADVRDSAPPARRPRTE